MTTREIAVIIENVVNRMKRWSGVHGKMESVQKVEECGAIEY